MKKIFAILICAVLVFTCFASCGSDTKETASSDASTEASTEASTAESSEESTVESSEDITVESSEEVSASASDPADLIGSWTADVEGAVLTFTFKEDGTGFYFAEYDGEVMSFNTVYTVDGSNLTITVEDFDDFDGTYEIKDGALIMTMDGETVTLTPCATTEIPEVSDIEGVSIDLTEDYTLYDNGYISFYYPNDYTKI